MKGTPASFWLSTANRAAGWWMGHAANAVRREQRAALTRMTKAAMGTARPKRKSRVKRRRAAR